MVVEKFATENAFDDYWIQGDDLIAMGIVLNSYRYNNFVIHSSVVASVQHNIIWHKKYIKITVSLLNLTSEMCITRLDMDG